MTASARCLALARPCSLSSLFAARFAARRPAPPARARARRLTLVVLPLETAYMFKRLFAHNGWSCRPAGRAGRRVDWVDDTVGPDAAVTIVPYPALPSAFFVSVASLARLRVLEQVDRA